MLNFTAEDASFDFDSLILHIPKVWVGDSVFELDLIMDEDVNFTMNDYQDLTLVDPGVWSVTADNVVARLLADPESSTNYLPEYPLTLGIRCFENKLDIYILWQEVIFQNDPDISDDEQLVTIEADDGSGNDFIFIHSAAHTAGLVPDALESKIIDLINKYNSLTFSIIQYPNRPIIAVFNTVGAIDAIQPILDVCNK